MTTIPNLLVLIPAAKYMYNILKLAPDRNTSYYQIVSKMEVTWALPIGYDL